MFRNPTALMQPVSRFQRAINIRYDLGDSEIVGQYVPTVSSSAAVATILRNTQSHQTQRAHVLHASYGSGKSHLGVAMAALLEQQNSLQPTLQNLVQRLSSVDSVAGALAQSYLENETRLLPVVLSGNEGDLATSLVRALVRALSEHGLDELRLDTRFDAALETIDRWQTHYPDVFNRFEAQLAERQILSAYQFKTLLENHDNGAYVHFAGLYTSLTAGAVFSPISEQSPEIVYRDVVTQLKKFGFSGVMVVWDEFGRYLEAHTTQAFGREAALLQDFAETCNHSADDEQIHLVLLTHRELQGYASSLPQSYQQEWSRIEGRFQRHNITTDSNVAFRLIAAALDRPVKESVVEHLGEAAIAQLVSQASKFRLFGTLSKEAIRKLVISTWPLHPLAVFALAHVSSRVAQNERTMFTFLTSDEPKALGGLIEQQLSANGKDDGFVLTADLWPYFEEAIRADIGGAGSHKHWSGVIHALDKVAADDKLGRQLMQSLGIINLCAEISSIRPTSELLSWAVGANTANEQADAVTTLDYLRRRKAIIHRQVDGYWTFITGSDINFEVELRTVLEQINPISSQLRRLLESYLPAPNVLARRYNQEFSMTRYFTGLYRWPEELRGVPWDTLIDELNTDGLVVYVLATNELEWQTAVSSLEPFERVVYVLPREGQQSLLSLREILRELFALQEINDDPRLRRHEDRERVQREINWLLEDAEGRLEQNVFSLTDPRRDNSLWITIEAEKAKAYELNSPGQATKLVSDICLRLYNKAPELISEGLNRHNPTAQQARAADVVISALFARQPSQTFGIEGSGPDALIVNSLLRRPGLLRKNNSTTWVLGQPESGKLAEIWQIISGYFDQCRQPTPLEPLIRKLLQPPYGLRRGVLPLLLAAVLRDRIKVSTIWHGRSAVGAVTGSILAKAIERPTDYAIQVGEWNQEHAYLWDALLQQFGNYVLETEWDRQPLEMISSAMLRWLQALPAFCRDTYQISPKALKFRNVIRQAIREPALALFKTLPEVLDLEETTEPQSLLSELDRLMQEISNAYLDLQHRLEVGIVQNFGVVGVIGNGLSTLKSWLASVSNGSERRIEEFRFGSLITQDFVEVILECQADDANIWNKFSEAVVGIPLKDWTDETEARFLERVLTARDEIERDIHDLVEEDKAITFSIEMPEHGKQDFRFRSSDLSSQGQRILQNFKSTMLVAGRPLSMDERRKVALAFLIHIMGEDFNE